MMGYYITVSICLKNRVFAIDMAADFAIIARRAGALARAPSAGTEE
jgi:hypothetical protein